MSNIVNIALCVVSVMLLAETDLVLCFLFTAQSLQTCLFSAAMMLQIVPSYIRGDDKAGPLKVKVKLRLT